MQSKAYWAMFLILPNHKETTKSGDDFFLMGERV